MDAYAEGYDLNWSVNWSPPTTGGIATQYRITTPGLGTQTLTSLTAFFNDSTWRFSRSFTIVARNAYGDGPAVSVSGDNGGNNCPPAPQKIREICQLQ
jgi:hypothetical protein